MSNIIRLIIFLYCIILLSIAQAQNVEPIDNTFASKPEVKIFIQEMVKKYKFKESELIALFNTIKIKPTVIQSVKTPLEQKPWYIYRILFLTDSRIAQGVEFWNKYQNDLEKAEKIYGVPANIIVATIGVESKYGQSKGEYPVIDALATLAFSDSPRAPYFRKELIEFLLLTREQHLNPLKVMGSYAGAIGQPQFMPSSYRNYAVNFSGNSKIDLSNNASDVIGSIANYYKKHGWETGQPVAIPASVAGGKYQFKIIGPKQIYLIDLINAGIIVNNPLSKDAKVKVIKLQGFFRNEYWLGFNNFDVIKRYNNSDLYAMAVYQLSYFITALREQQKQNT